MLRPIQIIREGFEYPDGRIIAIDAITWRDPKLPVYQMYTQKLLCEIFNLRREGHGDIWQHIILNDRKTSIPEQVELLLLESNVYRHGSGTRPTGVTTDSSHTKPTTSVPTCSLRKTRVSQFFSKT